MTDEAARTKKFDRWWGRYTKQLRARFGDAELQIPRGYMRDAFMAGAAAERAEHIRAEDMKASVKLD